MQRWIVGRDRSTRTERGQVMSSFVAVAATIAVVVGLLVLFGTRDPDGAAAPPSSPQTSTTPNGTPTSASPSSAPTSTPTKPAPPTVKPTTVVTTRTTTATATVTVRPTQPTRPAIPGQRPPVEIYNNTPQRGLAAQVASRAEASGWQVAGVDNWRGKVIGSTVYHPIGMQTAAETLAADLKIGRVKPALGNMRTDRLTVILTKDYAG